MKIARPRLLFGSLAVAVVVSLVGGYAWAQMVSDDGSDDAEPDAVLTDAAGSDGVVAFPDDGLTNAAVEGDPLPMVEVSDRNGDVVPTASFLGDPLVVNFWFSTCAPCRKELPDFAEVHAETGEEVRFIGVNPRDTVPAMERFAAERGVTYELYRDDLVEFQTELELVAFPVTIFVTSDGTIVEQTGVLDAEELREKVDNLLELDT